MLSLFWKFLKKNRSFHFFFFFLTIFHGSVELWKRKSKNGVVKLNCNNDFFLSSFFFSVSFFLSRFDSKSNKLKSVYSSFDFCIASVGYVYSQFIIKSYLTDRCFLFWRNWIVFANSGSRSVGSKPSAPMVGFVSTLCVRVVEYTRWAFCVEIGGYLWWPERVVTWKNDKNKYIFLYTEFTTGFSTGSMTGSDSETGTGFFFPKNYFLGYM